MRLGSLLLVIIITVIIIIIISQEMAGEIRYRKTRDPGLPNSENCMPSFPLSPLW